MNKEIRRLLREAEDLRRHHRYEAAAKCLERAALSGRPSRSAPPPHAGVTSDRADIWQSAARAWMEHGDRVQAGRCFLEASRLLDGRAKIDCHFASWKSYIDGIVREEWECGFAWRGEATEHSGDHEMHEGAIDIYVREAGQVLDRMLTDAGSERAAVLERAKAECARLEEQGGWGARRCSAILDDATGRA